MIFSNYFFNLTFCYYHIIIFAWICDEFKFLLCYVYRYMVEVNRLRILDVSVSKMLVFPIVEEGRTDEWFFMSSVKFDKNRVFSKCIILLVYHLEWLLVITMIGFWRLMHFGTRWTITLSGHFTFPEFKPLVCHGHLLPNVILVYDIDYILVHYWQHWVTVYKVSKYMSCHVSVSQYTDIQIYCKPIYR